MTEGDEALMGQTGTGTGRETVVDVELFAGPGGSSLGAHYLGLRPLGVEYDKWACKTRAAAGHWTVQADVSQFVLRPGVRLRGLIGSPPCPPWSNAGKGLGRLDEPRIREHLAACEDGWVPYSREGWHDDRSPLVLEPVRFIADYRPTWVMLEQVPGVLPFWQLVLAWMQRRSYKGFAQVLHCEEYGVPSTRERAIIGASLERAVLPPARTHRAWSGRPDFQLDLFELPQPVSMEQALGWGCTERPAPTVTGGGTASGGAEPFARGGREALAKEAGGGALA